MRDQTKKKILEAEKYYNDAYLDILEDESRNKFILVQLVVQQFWRTFEDASLEEDIRQAFKMEKVMLELETKLDDFSFICREISNY